MRDWTRRLTVLGIALTLAVLCELLVFNLRTLTVRGEGWTPLPTPECLSEMEKDGSCVYVFSGLDTELRACHMRITVRDEDGEIVPTNFTVALMDEGSSKLYTAGTVSYTPDHDRASWFSLHSYGKADTLQITVKSKQGRSCVLEAAEINGTIPPRISWKRTALVFLLLVLLYSLRPASPLHDNRLWNRHRRARALVVAAVLVLNLLALGWLVRQNTPFTEIPDESNWNHHHQYAKLAEALAKGQTWIDGPEDRKAISILQTLEDPYERYTRNARFKENGAVSPWDTAYYNGHLYVYFGVVPVLLTYLPYYLLTGEALPTVWAAMLSYGLVLAGAFLLLRSVIRRWFPRTPLTVWLLLSVLFGNCACVINYALAPSFYTVPVSFALGFSWMALALWISAGERWARALRNAELPAAAEEFCFRPLRSERGVGWRLAAGGLCGALVAGCRPQFLVFSVLALPLFLGLMRRDRRHGRTALRLLVLALPYAVVAAGLMYYNAIRFGSPFDFGANYNLTTNNMPLRGWKLDRLPDGLYAYLLRTPNVDLIFPFFHNSPASLTYMGMTIREVMFGGVLLVQPFLWFLLGARRAWPTLREKKLRVLVLLPLLLALIVAAADTEMAGILWRYTGDFLPLLYVAALPVFLAGAPGDGALSRRRRGLLLAAVFTSLAICFFIGIIDGSMESRAPESFYRLKDFFCN